MWGTSRALQIDWTALVQEPWEGPNIATTPRASWSQAGKGREGKDAVSEGGVSTGHRLPPNLDPAAVDGQTGSWALTAAEILGNENREERRRRNYSRWGSGPGVFPEEGIAAVVC